MTALSYGMAGTPKYLWHQVPVFRVLWPYIGGVVAGIFMPDALLVHYACAVLLLVVLLGAMAGPAVLYRTGFWLLAFTIAGWTMTTLHTDRLFHSHYSFSLPQGATLFTGKVVSDPVVRERSIKCEVELSHVFQEGRPRPVKGTILVYVQKDTHAFALRYGDIMAFRASLQEIPAGRNPGEFNYKRYMAFHQIGHQAYLPEGRWVMLEQGSGLLRFMQGIQKRAITLLQEHGLGEGELAILSALVLGYKHHLSADQVSAFSSTGAMHVLAVSGLHVGIVFLLVGHVLAPLDRLRHGKMLKPVLALAVLWAYAALTGLSPSVNRAATMFSAVIIAQLWGRYTDVYNTLAVSALLLLVWNPFLIVEVGFQLSYLAVIGIVVLQPHIYGLWQPRNWLLDKTWAITAVSIAAQMATFPLGLLYFHQFPNYFLLSNLVVIPAATVILPVGIALLCLAWVPFLSDVLALVLYYLVHWLDVFIQWMECLPFALVEGIDIGIAETYLIYMVVITGMAFLVTTRYRWLVAFLVTLCIIEVLNITEVGRQQRQKAVVFYSIKGHDAIDIIEGAGHVLRADTGLFNKPDKMRFHIHHHWWQRGLEPPSDRLENLHEQGVLLAFRGLNVVMADDTTVFTGNVNEVDILFVRGRTRQHPSEVLRCVNPHRVILSSCLDWKTGRYWKKLLDARGTAVHDLGTDGAFTAEI